MKSVVIGTAGHIDHGKTALVKALTGIDADRLEEEKRRGITIDLGFAHLEVPGPDGETLRLGFVDVPGHERFVRNMLAGIGGIDLVLLVIAADEGIKPQTREHFDICRLLSIRRGITVLTKADMVDSETLNVVRLEVGEFLRGSFLEGAAIITASSLTGAGIPELKQALAAMSVQIPARDQTTLSRLPIDRVFTMKGFGTVVTGTLISGTIRKEDELEVFPKGRRVRARGVQVHGKLTGQALAGQRTALNLSGLEKAELSRGMTLAPPGTLQASSRVDVSLSLLPSAKPLKDRARIHFHAYTSETIAEVRLRTEDRELTTDISLPSIFGAQEGYAACPEPLRRLLPGKNGFAHLRLAEPLLLLPGDHFIIRQFSPVITIGGGVVLDASPAARPGKEGSQAFLRTLASGNPGEVLEVRVARRADRGLPLRQLVAETGWRAVFVEEQLAPALAAARVIRSGDMFVHAAAIEDLKLNLAGTLASFHQGNPLEPGIGKEALRERLGVGPEIFALVTAALAREKKIEVTGDLVHLANRGVVMKDEESEARKTIETAFASAGLQVPALKDILAGLKLDKTRAHKIMTLLLREKVLVKISDDLVFHHTALDDLRRRMASEKARSSRVDVGRFKELTGVSRKYAIPLLEYLDRERVTKRVGDERIIL